MSWRFPTRDNAVTPRERSPQALRVSSATTVGVASGAPL
jgi:hypothetical protein